MSGLSMQDAAWPYNDVLCGATASSDSCCSSLPNSHVTFPIDTPSFGTLALPRGLWSNIIISYKYNLTTQLEPHCISRLLLRFAREQRTWEARSQSPTDNLQKISRHFLVSISFPMPSSYALLLTKGTKIKFPTVLLLHYCAKMIDRRLRFELST